LAKIGVKGVAANGFFKQLLISGLKP